jgi:dolichol-phosphate mannosyltransferase
MMSNLGIAVIIPAYNERQSLQILLKDIGRNLPDALVVVVDDSSSDEAIRLSEMLRLNFPKTILISRGQKLGRGSAVIRGLAEALKHRQIQYCFEMDADLAHSPAEFSRFLAVRKGTDLVIGSRYLKQSHIVKWPWRRLIQSRIINASLNIWLGLRLTDYTNGFRLYSRKAAEFLTGACLQETGFIALSEIAYKLRRNGFRITEVPITFRDRTYGASNANLKELVRSLVGAVRIRMLQ